MRFLAWTPKIFWETILLQFLIDMMVLIKNQEGVELYSIMMLMKFSDLSQSDCSNWVMWQVGDACPRPGWDGCLTWEKMAFIKSVKTWIILLYIWLHI